MVAGEVALRRLCERRVLDDVPYLRHEAVRVHVHGLHAAAGDGYLPALAGRCSNLPCRRTQETVAAHEKTGRRTGSVSDEVSAISHARLPGV